MPDSLGILGDRRARVHSRQIGGDGGKFAVRLGRVNSVEPLFQLVLGDAALGVCLPQRCRRRVSVSVASTKARILDHPRRLLADLRDSSTRGRLGSWSGSAW